MSAGGMNISSILFLIIVHVLILSLFPQHYNLMFFIST